MLFEYICRWKSAQLTIVARSELDARGKAQERFAAGTRITVDYHDVSAQFVREVESEAA